MTTILKEKEIFVAVGLSRKRSSSASNGGFELVLKLKSPIASS
jgi:hypothetical protein